MRWRCAVAVSTLPMLLCLPLVGCRRKEVQPVLPPTLFHIVYFDDQGNRLKPAEDDKALAEAKGKQVTDVFLVSHGWNTSRSDAVTAYEAVRSLVLKIQNERPGDLPKGYQPLLVGIHWPSKAWDEEETKLEGGGPRPLTADQLAALRESLRGDPASKEADLKKIKLLSEKIAPTPVDWDEAKSLFQKHSYSEKELAIKAPDDAGVFELANSKLESAGVEWEGRFPSIRDAARVFTFWQMKRRAGVVGESGGRELLDLLRESCPDARVHLIGHSFGCKLLLSALIAPGRHSDKSVQSIILLQGALSHLAFADKVLALGTPGGYQKARTLVAGPLVATFSENDVPLGTWYPLGARFYKAKDLTEAAGPSLYSALGAVGINAVDATNMNASGKEYSFGEEPRMYSIAAHQYIKSHGDYTNGEVAWLIWATAFRK